MTEEHIDEYIDEAPLTRLGAELQAIMDRRELSLEELADGVTEAGYRVEPGLLKLWMTGESLVDIEFLRTMIDVCDLTREEMRDVGAQHIGGGEFVQAETGKPTGTLWHCVQVFQGIYECKCPIHKLLHGLVLGKYNPGGYPALDKRLEQAGYAFSGSHVYRAIHGEEELEAQLVSGIIRVLGLEGEDKENLTLAYLEHLAQEPYRPIEMVHQER
jgi:hypothetical protein